MKGYIYQDDCRSCFLNDLFIQNNYEMVSDVNDADFIFVGKDNQRIIKEKINFTLIRDDLGICINDNQSFRKDNNYLTVLALINLLIQNHHLPICTKVLILGYGDLAKRIIKLLNNLNNEITVVNRNNKNHLEIIEHYHHQDINNINYDYNFIFNTIPDNYLDSSKFTNQIIYDLAGKLETKYSNYYNYKALPNDYYPSYSALLIFKVMKDVLNNVEK